MQGVVMGTSTQGTSATPINAPANHRARLCSLIKACFRAPRNLTLRYTHKQMDDFLADMCDTPGAAAAEPEGESDMLTMGDVMEEAGIDPGAAPAAAPPAAAHNPGADLAAIAALVV